MCAHDPFIQVIDVGGTQTYRYCGKVISYWAGVHNYLLRWLFFYNFIFKKEEKFFFSSLFLQGVPACNTDLVYSMGF